jgi:flagellar protein FliO/FliZ
VLWYILKLLVLLPLIAGLAWGSLILLRKLQERGGGNQAAKSVRVIETTMLSPTLKLAVIEFHGKEILVSASRSGLTRLAEAPARARFADVSEEFAH